MTFVARQISNTIRALMAQYPVVAVTGPRQSGKTTLLQTMFPDYQYVSLENSNMHTFAQNDPLGFLKKYPGNVIFDEVQRVPDLFSYLQTEVDSRREMGRFVLSGSQNFQLMERVTQTLAGRVALFKLLPFDFEELRAADLLPDEWQKIAIRGSYPALYDRGIDAAVFYANYIQTYVERDVTALLRVQDLRQFRNFISLCAARTGQLLNLNNLANECGISQPTAKAWLSILESSYLIFLLQPYYENFSKRVVKTPKLYFYDTGLVSFLLGLRDTGDIDPVLSGALFENLIIAEVFKINHHRYTLRDYWFWRDQAGNEVDLLTKKGRRFSIAEIKSTQTILPRHFAGLDKFSELVNDMVDERTLIYGGRENEERSRYRVKAWNEPV